MVLGFTAVKAQQGPSPMVGKIIHVYNPIPGESLFVDMSGTGYRMTEAAGNWLNFTVPANIQNHITKFGVRSDYGRQPSSIWITKSGIASGGADAFSVDDFAGGNEIWIVIDPSGPVTGPPAVMLEAPKVINVFNPWPTTAPVLSLAGGTKKGMLTVAGNCGWFWAFLIKPAEQSFFLEEVNGADSYGSGGLGNKTPYNMATEFTSKGSTLWLDTDINAWLGADPKKNRPCGYQMAAIVRDFSPSHVDFDFGQAPDAVITGMVENVLPANKKPVRTSKTHQHFNQFDDWFNTKAGVNEETCVDIPMTQSDNGMWMYDSYTTPERGYWPIDNFTTTAAGAPNPHNQKTLASCYVKPDGTSWVTNQPPHNMNFCLESHATFIYQKGQKFEFRGDDDVWVYINNKLEIDLGGLHTPKADTIDLDKLNLTAGQTYNWDFYYCERQPCGSSLKVKTSIYFKQQRALEAVPDPAKPGSYKIVKYSGGSGACGSLGTEVKEVPVPAGSLIYKLWNSTGTELESLGEGSFHNGGIVIATPSVVVDTAKITALPPGNYRVVAFEPASPTIKAEVPFVIANRSWVQFKLGQDVSVPVGTLVPVIAANQVGDATPAGVGSYTFKVDPATGLSIFDDQAKTTPVTAFSRSTGADGLDTIWVTGDPNAITDVTYTLSIPNSLRPVRVTFTLPPLVVPKLQSAFIYDENGDGKGDRIVATFDSSIAANLPKQVSYQWPASGAAVTLDNTALAGKAAANVLTLSGLTTTANEVTSGQGTFTSVFPGRGTATVSQSVPLVEKIAPVVIKATMFPGTVTDTLRITLSEPVAKDAITALPAQLFVYRLGAAGAEQTFVPVGAPAWNATSTGVELLFPSDSAQAPRPGNLVRVAEGPGRITDAAGNAPGANSQFVLIGGKMFAQIKTVTYWEVDKDKLVANPEPIVVSVQPTTAKIEDVVAQTGRLGHLVKVDMADLAQATDPSKVIFEYSVAYFTNHGTPVVSEKAKRVPCNDTKVFGTDCRVNRGYPYVGWNFTALDKQRVGTGAYIARIKYRVTVDALPIYEGELAQTWGVVRKN